MTFVSDPLSAPPEIRFYALQCPAYDTQWHLKSIRQANQLTHTQVENIFLWHNLWFEGFRKLRNQRFRLNHDHHGIKTGTLFQSEKTLDSNRFVISFLPCDLSDSDHADDNETEVKEESSGKLSSTPFFIQLIRVTISHCNIKAAQINDWATSFYFESSLLSPVIDIPIDSELGCARQPAMVSECVILSQGILPPP